MRRLLKVVGILLGVVVLLLAGVYAYVLLTWQRDYRATPLPDIVASTDPDVIARGEYVVHAVAHCSACHMLTEMPKPGTTIDWNHALTGGYVWDIPLFGRFVAANITPDVETGIGGMNDRELARAIRHGVNRHGHILPFMLLATGSMSDEDLTAVVSWLRSRPAVRQQNPTEEWGLMAKALSGSFTPRMTPPPANVPGGGASVERGRYLAEGPAACGGCHTERDPLTFALTGSAFAGNTMAEADAANPGFEFVYPNLTPDPETGHITAWDEAAFVGRLHAGRVHPASAMPWENYSRMTDDDLRSIYRFLRSLPPVRNVVGPPHRKAGEKPPGT